MTDAVDADRHLQDIVAAAGIHVVHVWAPWCDNSLHELEPVWSHDTGADSVTFVTVWNNGKDGQEELDERAIPERVEVLTQLDRGDSSDKSNRRKTFLDIPMTWIPTA